MRSLMGGPLRPGTISWTDLTVEDAEAPARFCASVAGWTPEALPMAGYSDFVMNNDSNVAIAGICHARGANADLPPQWLTYITVDDLVDSMAECVG
jgi:uncharacterized protein